MTTTETAALVRQMREVLETVGLAEINDHLLARECREAILKADQWLTGADAAGIMQLIDEYANAVHDGADDRCAALRRTIEGSLLYTAQQPPREVERLSDCQLKKTVTAWYGSIYWTVDYRQVARAVESACAEAWGLKLKEQ